MVMSGNDKKEEKLTLNFREDQCDLISEALLYISARCDERMGSGTVPPFDQFTSAQIKKRVMEIVEQIAEVTS